MSDCENPAVYIKEGRNKQRWFLKHAKDYAESTSVHGIKYITESGRHFCERYK